MEINEEESKLQEELKTTKAIEDKLIAEIQNYYDDLKV